MLACYRISVPIARITSQGLAVIALLVAVLWGCILAENAINRSAEVTRRASLHELRMLRAGLRKVSVPAPVHEWRALSGPGA